jgi:hypothetical protein
VGLDIGLETVSPGVLDLSKIQSSGGGRWTTTGADGKRDDQRTLSAGRRSGTSTLVGDGTV